MSIPLPPISGAQWMRWAGSCSRTGPSRDWLYVEDHCRAIEAILERGRIGESYNVGGSNEWTNLSVVKAVCAVLDELEKGPWPSFVTQIKEMAELIPNATVSRMPATRERSRSST